MVDSAIINAINNPTDGTALVNAINNAVNAPPALTEQARTLVKQIYKHIIDEQSTQDHTLEVILQNIMRHRITGENNITTHYIESGTDIQDVTTTNPLTIEVEGWMADIAYSMHPVFQWLLAKIVQTANVPIIGGFVATRLTSITFVINLLYEQIRYFLDWYNKYFNRLNDETTVPPWKTHPKSSYDDPLITFEEDKKLGYQLSLLEDLRLTRLPISLTIPRVGTFHNMVLKNYVWDQDKSYYQAKMTLVFQQVRTTRTVLTRLVNGTVKERESEGKRDEKSTIK